MPTDEDIQLARYIASAFETEPVVQGYLNEDESDEVDILRCHHSPQKNVTSFATIGLSNLGPNASQGLPENHGVEILASVETSAFGFDELLATCALSIKADDIKVYPGSYVPNVFELHDDVSKTMSSIVFMHPFLWGDGITKQIYRSKTVVFLQALPISEAETDYLNEYGVDKLEGKFIEHQIDVFDINRKSVV